jgi:dolichol-phosphate mannosyltransferase
VPEQESVSIIIPVYNEEEVLPTFHRRLCEVIDGLPYDFNMMYVCGGSTDGTLDKLLEIAADDSRVEALELSRRFGHQAALTAGLDLAEGDFVVMLDGDGQHPPSLIPEMLEMAQSGFDVVLTQRVDPQGGRQIAGAFKGWTSALFYRLINRIGDTHILPGGADFRLMTRQTVLALRELRETHRFLRGMVGWMGFRTAVLPYSPEERLAGRTKYSLGRLLRLSTDAVFSFSLIPLYFIIFLGALFLLGAVAEVIYVLSLWFIRPDSLPAGWSSLMFILLVVGGTVMVSVGVIGVYVGYIFQEVKRRPLYLIRRRWRGGEQGERSADDGDSA